MDLNKLITKPMFFQTLNVFLLLNAFLSFTLNANQSQTKFSTTSFIRPPFVENFMPSIKGWVNKIFYLPPLKEGKESLHQEGLNDSLPHDFSLRCS